MKFMKQYVYVKNNRKCKLFSLTHSNFEESVSGMVSDPSMNYLCVIMLPC